MVFSTKFIKNHIKMVLKKYEEEEKKLTFEQFKPQNKKNEVK